MPYPEEIHYDTNTAPSFPSGAWGCIDSIDRVCHPNINVVLVNIIRITLFAHQN